MIDVWVNPTGGNDANDGTTRARALKSFTAAWALVPRDQTLTGSGSLRGVRIRITPGEFGEDACECASLLAGGVARQLAPAYCRRHHQ